MVAWSLLAQFSFYATSHQPTLSQIDWHAAFVGRQSSLHHDHTNIISAIMVLLNTFGGPILIFVLYPLIIVSSPTLYAKYESLGPKPIKTETKAKIPQEILNNKAANVIEPMHDFEIARGCLPLIENEYLFMGSLFQTGAILVAMQGLRVCFLLILY